MKLYLLFILLFFNSIFLKAQQMVKDPNFGFQFSVPDGWHVVNNTQESYLFTSNNYPGLIIVAKEPLTDLMTIKQNLLASYSDSITQLESNGIVETLWTNALGTDVKGIILNTRCRAYMVDVLVPDIAVGSVLVAVDSAQFNDVHKRMCIQIAKSITKGTSDNNLYQVQSQVYTNQLKNQQYNQTTTSTIKDLGGMGDAASEFAGHRLVWWQTSENERQRVTLEFCKNGTFIGYEYHNINGISIYADDVEYPPAQGTWRLDKQGQNYKLTTIDQQGHKGEVIVYPWIDENGDKHFKIDGKDFSYFESVENCY